MASRKKTPVKPGRSPGSVDPMAAGPARNPGKAPADSGSFWSRDNIENILVAIILALLFRGFEAEAFVIPTGSMAPTLMGRHKDIRCEKCGYRFQTGESEDATPEGWTAEEQRQYRIGSRITQVICPSCRFPTDTSRNQRKFVPYNGDRILVNKFAYENADPQRWDVIVFKYPGNAKQNYIKRLVGLPNETLKIEHGDVFVGPRGGSTEIARKPPRKLPHIMQVVHDSHNIAPDLVAAGWPSFWFDAEGSSEASTWKISSDQKEYSLDGGGDTPRWLRYRHVMPSAADWQAVSKGKLPPDAASRRGQLITDFYAYNSWSRATGGMYSGWYWVGDLGLECDLQVRSPEGEIVLDLVEAGRHHTCTIDVATGEARLAIDGGQLAFDPNGQGTVEVLRADTPVRKRGRYRLRFTNADNQLLLWVNDKLMSFTADTLPHNGAYTPPTREVPVWRPDNPGDLNPVGIAGKGVDLTVNRLRVLRDTYYVAVKSGVTGREEYTEPVDFREVAQIMATPESWQDTPLFDLRGSVTFDLQEDQFFPMGDNSPFSKDARLWGTKGTRGEPSYTAAGRKSVDPWIHRDMLIGKAFLVYWPHGWDLGPIPLRLFPNVTQMKWIH